jgi:hypothetical protein
LKREDPNLPCGLKVIVDAMGGIRDFMNENLDFGSERVEVSLLSLESGYKFWVRFRLLSIQEMELVMSSILMLLKERMEDE